MEIANKHASLIGKEYEKTYMASVRCTNCGLGSGARIGIGFSVEIEKGVQIKDFPCPVCGCKCLQHYG